MADQTFNASLFKCDGFGITDIVTVSQGVDSDGNPVDTMTHNIRCTVNKPPQRTMGGLGCLVGRSVQEGKRYGAVIVDAKNNVLAFGAGNSFNEITLDVGGNPFVFPLLMLTWSLAGFSQT